MTPSKWARRPLEPSQAPTLLGRARDKWKLFLNIPSRALTPFSHSCGTVPMIAIYLRSVAFRPHLDDVSRETLSLSTALFKSSL